MGQNSSEKTLSLAVDIVIFSLQKPENLKRMGILEEENLQSLHILLARRARDPFNNFWALPGGRVRFQEDLEQSAVRHLSEKTGLRAAYLEQLYTFGKVDRDPRGHTVSVVYYALVRSENQEFAPGSGTAEVKWFPAHALPGQLAFDHAEITAYALWRLRNKIKYANIAVLFLPPVFTLSQLRLVYEGIMGRKEDPGNFKRKVEANGSIIRTPARVEGGRHRPPGLYKAVVPDGLL